MNDQSFSNERPAEAAVSRLRRQWLRNGRDAFAAWADDWSAEEAPTLQTRKLAVAAAILPRLTESAGRC